MTSDDRFGAWIQALEARYLDALTFPEIARALRALSSIYVERRNRLGDGGALSGRGKRAAFALFYGPLHYLLVREIVRALPKACLAEVRHDLIERRGAAAEAATIVDLGCGTGASGAAWAGALDRTPHILGIDRHPWVVDEAAWTYRQLGLTGRTRQGDVTRAAFPPSRTSLLAAFTVNELSDAGREVLLARLLERGRRKDRVLIVEPIAGVVTRWWRPWRDQFELHGGRADQWRFRVELPPIVAKLDRAAGLDHRELTGRSLWLGEGSG